MIILKIVTTSLAIHKAQLQMLYMYLLKFIYYPNKLVK